jgi:hypothetical protein
MNASALARFCVRVSTMPSWSISLYIDCGGSHEEPAARRCSEQRTHAVRFGDESQLGIAGRSELPGLIDVLGPSQFVFAD